VFDDIFDSVRTVRILDDSHDEFVTRLRDAVECLFEST
jgi:hypothetical protein